MMSAPVLTGWQVAPGNRAVARVPGESVEARARRLFPLALFAIDAAQRSVSVTSPVSNNTYTVTELPDGRLTCNCEAGKGRRRCWHVTATVIFLALWEVNGGGWPAQAAPVPATPRAAAPAPRFTSRAAFDLERERDFA